MILMNKLCLGTVQFGLDYGVSNDRGKVAKDDACQIMSDAYEAGVRWLDTSSDYGDSESLIGAYLSQSDNAFHIMTKSSDCSQSSTNIDEARASIVRDIAQSKAHIRTIDVLYIRNLHTLLQKFGKGVVDMINDIQGQYEIGKIGSSVYTKEDIDQILEHYKPQVLQIPHSVLDQRLKQDGTIEALKSNDIEVHVRSIFLQGLIFMNGKTRPSFFDPVSEELDRIHENMRATGMKPLDAALRYILDQDHIDRFIFGVTSQEELQAICASVKKQYAEPMDWDIFALHDPFYLNPVNWRF